MRILYLSQYFPPEVGATQTRAYEMATNLVTLGHSVTVMTEVPNHPSGIIRPEYRSRFRVAEEMDGIRVIRSWVYATPVKNFRTRMLFYISFVVTTILNSLNAGKYDVVYATSPPLFVGIAGLIIAKLRGIPLVFEVRDLWPESAIELGQLNNPRHVRYGHATANLCYQHAKGIVGVTRGICAELKTKKLPADKLFLIKNGTNPNRYRYIFDRGLEKELGWEGKFIVLYAGIHGMAQGLETVLEAAELLKHENTIHFAFIGEGPTKDNLMAQAEEHNLLNVEFLPEVSSDEIAKYISLADICLVPLKKKKLFEGALPSKIFDCWACGKPILLTVDGEARQELEAARGGVFADPEDSAAMADAILGMYKNPVASQQMGENGKRYVYKAGYIRSQQARTLSGILIKLLEIPSAPKKIKVLRIITRLNIGGPAIHVALLTQGLDPAKFESTLITGKVSPEEGDMSYLVDALNEKVVVVPELQRELNLVKDMKALYRVLKVLNQHKPDIVHTHTAKAGTIGRIAVFLHNLMHRRKVGVVHTFHGHVFRGYFGKLKSLFFVWAERLLAKIADVIVVVSESQKGELCRDYGIGPTKKFRTVKLGFDLEPFFSADRLKGVFRRSLGVDGDTILVGIVGRLVPIKNHKMFLRSARIFLDRNPDVSAKFLIIGDGELREELVNFCAQQGLSGHVQFCGWRHDLPKVYADLDILCLTSINEGTPVSIIEAMAASVPVISTDAGGVRDLLGMLVPGISQNGFQVLERGVLCRQDDPEGFAGGLQYMIQNRRIWEEISGSARSFVSRVYAREHLLKNIESVYLELVRSDQMKGSSGTDAAG
jgi:glycosyltransferase involved in cell wall biosynthesis